MNLDSLIFVILKKTQNSPSSLSLPATSSLKNTVHVPMKMPVQQNESGFQTPLWNELPKMVAIRRLLHSSAYPLPHMKEKVTLQTDWSLANILNPLWF